jgi:hypothetical protein
LFYRITISTSEIKDNPSLLSSASVAARFAEIAVEEQ